MSKSFEETDTRVSAFGERLRRERQLRGISLDEIAAATKIGTRLLRALEEGQFELLPGGIFNKGYVRAYARHIGIDEERAVADYLQAADETSPDVTVIARQNASARASIPQPVNARFIHRSGFPLIPTLVLLVVIVGGAGGWHLYEQRQRERRQPARINDATAAQPSLAGQSTNSNSIGNSASLPGESASSPGKAGVSPATPDSPSAIKAPVHTVEAAELSPHPSSSNAALGSSSATGTTGAETGAAFEVTVRAKDRARVQIKSDGKVLIRGVMNPTDVKTIHATNKVVFWTGNAGEVEISFNGKNVLLNGGENDEQVLVFNSHGLLPVPATQ